MKNMFYLIILCSFSLCAMKRGELSNQIRKNLNNSLPEFKNKKICLLRFFGYLSDDLVPQKGNPIYPIHFCYLCGVPSDIRNSVLPNLKKEFTVKQIKESTSQFETLYTYLILSK